MCMYAVARPMIPSEVTVHNGRSTAPSWSGMYSSVMLIPSQKSSVQQMKLCTSLRGSTPASAYAFDAASNIISLVDSPGVIVSKPEYPTPTIPTLKGKEHLFSVQKSVQYKTS